MDVTGIIVDVLNETQFPGKITVDDGKITAITKLDTAPHRFILPGFVDAHVHIESSMLVPSEFARIAVRHGTVATVSDPHEIGNVLGIHGVEYMIDNAKHTPLKCYFGAPSCVPATSFETSGATIGPEEVRQLLERKDVVYLSEMMNYPGVLTHDSHVMQKIQAAKSMGKRIDGHAPGLRGEDLEKYIREGPSTDHETFELEEGREKIKKGMKIIIREGSAAKNFDALWPLLKESPEMCMLCGDDKHPDDLMEGHINTLVQRAVAKGVPVYNALKAACINPVRHYGLDVGLLREGDPADFVVVDSLETFGVLETYINGKKVADKGKSLIQTEEAKVVNNFNTDLKNPLDFVVNAEGDSVHVIEALNGQLITNDLVVQTKKQDGVAVSDPDQDILKIAVVNRYHNAPPAVGFVKNIGLKTGAIATSVAHDSHNIIAVGVDDVSLCLAINLVIAHQGGLAAVGNGEEKVLPLPVAGIMTTKAGEDVAREYKEIDAFAKQLGSQLTAPFMTLSFLNLLVIPKLKLSDKGLFDGVGFRFLPLFA